MLANVVSGALWGINAFRVDVEVDVAHGLPQLNIVGLPDKAVRESQERVRAAIKNSGLSIPSRRITINLAPADIRKEGAAFDLPIALGVLACLGVFPVESLEGWMVAGELALDGAIKPVRGALPLAAACRDLALKGFILPAANASEAAVAESVDIIGVHDLAQVIRFLNGVEGIAPAAAADFEAQRQGMANGVDLNDVKGQEHVKRALEVSAAGGHNLIMIGPPGSGETMRVGLVSSTVPANAHAARSFRDFPVMDSLGMSVTLQAA
ncbi:MAG: ATP-binding protein [Myxococcales bacterium]|nr:MAG: ATP-binding protein [Myxococcales bacterium]